MCSTFWATQDMVCLLCDALSAPDLANLARTSRAINAGASRSLYRHVKIRTFRFNWCHPEAPIAPFRALCTRVSSIQSLQLDTTAYNTLPTSGKAMIAPRGESSFIQLVSLIILRMSNLRSLTIHGDIDLPPLLGTSLRLLPALRKLRISAGSHLSSHTLTLPGLTELVVDELSSYRTPPMLPICQNLQRLELSFSKVDFWLPWEFVGEMPSSLVELQISHCPVVLEPDCTLQALPLLQSLQLIECECAESFFSLAGDGLTELVVQPIAWTSLRDFLTTTKSTLLSLSCFVEGERYFQNDLIESMIIHGNTLQELVLDGRYYNGYTQLPVPLWRRLAKGLPHLKNLALRPIQSSRWDRNSVPSFTLQYFPYPRLERLQELQVLGEHDSSSDAVYSMLYAFYSKFLEETQEDCELIYTPSLGSVVIWQGDCKRYRLQYHAGKSNRPRILLIEDKTGKIVSEGDRRQQ